MMTVEMMEIVLIVTMIKTQMMFVFTIIKL